MTGDRYAAVFPLPLCEHCRHTWPAHWSDEGCQAPTGPDTVCGCRVPAPDGPERPASDKEERAA